MVVVVVYFRIRQLNCFGIKLLAGYSEVRECFYIFLKSSSIHLNIPTASQNIPLLNCFWLIELYSESAIQMLVIALQFRYLSSAICSCLLINLIQQSSLETNLRIWILSNIFQKSSARLITLKRVHLVSFKQRLTHRGVHPILKTHILQLLRLLSNLNCFITLASIPHLPQPASSCPRNALFFYSLNDKIKFNSSKKFGNRAHFYIFQRVAKGLFEIVFDETDKGE